MIKWIMANKPTKTKLAKVLTVAAIVPVYNEEKTVGHVLEILAASKRFAQIICVNDGSKDRSIFEIKCQPKVQLINFKRNRGKGFALAAGIKAATTDLVALFDSDLSTLNTDHVDKMLDAFKGQNFDGVIAYENGEFLSVFSGQRVYRRQDLLKLVPEMKKSEYGIEVLLNAAFKDQHIKQVKLVGLGHLQKHEKYDRKEAINIYFSQWFVSVLKQTIKSGISPEHFKSILTELSDFIFTKVKKLKSSKN
jgi:polyisoprenyl-phosphate glycosyltransferase